MIFSCCVSCAYASISPALSVSEPTNSSPSAMPAACLDCQDPKVRLIAHARGDGASPGRLHVGMMHQARCGTPDGGPSLPHAKTRNGQGMNEETEQG